MSVLLHAVPLAGVCRKERSSAVPPVRAGPEEMRCVGSKRTPEVGRFMLLAASIVKFSGPKRHGGNRTVSLRCPGRGGHVKILSCDFCVLSGPGVLWHVSRTCTNTSGPSDQLFLDLHTNLDT